MRVHRDFGHECARWIFESSLDVRDCGLRHAYLLREFGLRQPCQLARLPDSSPAKPHFFFVPVAFSCLRLMGRSAGVISRKV